MLRLDAGIGHSLGADPVSGTLDVLFFVFGVLVCASFLLTVIRMFRDYKASSEEQAERLALKFCHKH